jgi:formiminoglutamate deiminase
VSVTAAQLWCELAWLGGDRAERGVLVEIADDRIVSVTTDVRERPSAAERLRGLVLPGFANAHSHAFHRALRGRTHAGRGTFWTWREQMYAVADRLQPDTYLALARATFAEMALAGITTVGEFHYLHHGPGGVPYADANEMGLTVAQAAHEAGIRMTLLDTCYLHGGIGQPLNGVQRRFGDGTADAWADRAGALSPGPHALVGAAVHSVRAVDPASITTVAAWAAQRGAPLHAHVSEQPAENDACLASYGRTPVEVFADVGALSERFSAVHAIHLTDRDIGLLGGSRSCVCCCPTTERDLADGITPASRLRAAGAALSLGSDSHAVIDPYEEARAVELDERLASRERGNHAVVDLLAAATNHASLGWNAGRIEAGALADLVVIGLDSVRLAGADAATALPSVVYAATAADVRHVMVGGRWVVRDGAHQSFDVPSALRSAVAAVWSPDGNPAG